MGAIQIIPVTKTNAPIFLKVDFDTGLDSNPVTLALPLKTMVEAEDRLPDIIDRGHHVTIDVEGSVTQYVMPIFRHRLLYADIFVTSTDYTTQAGVGATGTADAASTTEKLVFGAGGMTVDAFRNMWVVFDTGPNAGDERSINENTAGDIIPSRPFTAAPDATSTYRVVRPAAVMTCPDPGQVLVDGGLVIRGQQINSFVPGSPQHWFHGFGIDASAVTAFSASIALRDPTNFYMINTSFASKRINLEFSHGNIGVGGPLGGGFGASNAPADAGLIGDISEWDGNGWCDGTQSNSFLDIAGASGHGDTQNLQVVIVGGTLSLSDAAIFGGDLRRPVASGNSPLLLTGRCLIFGPSATLPIKCRAVTVGVSLGRKTNQAYADTCAAINIDVEVTDPAGTPLLNDGWFVANASVWKNTNVTAGVALRCRKGVIEFSATPTLVATDAECSFDGVTGFPQSEIASAGDSRVSGGGIATFMRN